jgi:hypothetical protein
MIGEASSSTSPKVLIMPPMVLKVVWKAQKFRKVGGGGGGAAAAAAEVARTEPDRKGREVVDNLTVPRNKRIVTTIKSARDHGDGALEGAECGVVWSICCFRMYPWTAVVRAFLLPGGIVVVVELGQ